jgi:hypothetical protein
MSKSVVFLLVFFLISHSPSLLAEEEHEDQNTLTKSEFLIPIEEIIAQFSLVDKDPDSFIINLDLSTIVPAIEKKNYFKPLWDITKLNFVVWTFDRLVLDGTWTRISLNTISDNFKSGLVWDYDDFGTNQFGHPYHGALFHSIARCHGMNFIESSVYTYIGSLTWEFLWEAERPGRNDHYFSAFGGIHLGEALYRMASLISYKKSTGINRILKKTLQIIVNPVVGVSDFPWTGSESENAGMTHVYDFKLPIGAFYSSDNETIMFIRPRFEYRNGIQNDGSKLRPYDWFHFQANIGISDHGIRDPVLSTYGVLFGKKFQNGCTGLFGLFDYMDTHMAQQMSAVGIGPGFATSSESQSNLFLNSSGVFSFVFGSSSATIPYSHPDYELENTQPYHFGPGLMGKIKFEMGKKGLGSFYTGFSKYWINATLVDAKEVMSVISFDLNLNMSARSQISLGYDYYIRSARLENQHFTRSKNAIRAMYVLSF